MLKKLAALFENEREMPIEIPELSKAITEVLCVQDHITFSEEDMNIEICRGAFYQYTKHAAVYSPPEWHSVIVYSKNQDLDWKRMACFKEVMHVFDKATAKTSGEATLSAFTEALLRPIAMESIEDYQAMEDRHAAYRALAVIFPLPARQDAIESINSGAKTIEDIVNQVCLPKHYIEMVLHEKWPEIRASLLE